MIGTRNNTRSPSRNQLRMGPRLGVLDMRYHRCQVQTSTTVVRSFPSSGVLAGPLARRWNTSRAATAKPGISQCAGLALVFWLMVALAVGQEQPPPPPPAPASPFTLPDTSPPPGPVKPERLNASVEGDVVKGSPVELEAEVAFLFKTEKGYVVLRSEAGDLLVEEPALTCPPGLKAEIKTAVAELARVDVGDGIGEGFAIRCRLVVTAEASAPLGEQAITVAFPAASKAAGIIKAVSPKDAPTCTYNVQVFESFEQLEKTKAAELVAQEETRRAEQDAKLSTDGDVINGVPARLEGEVEFVFWTDKVKGSYRKVPIAFALTEDYKLVAPPGLKVTVESVSIEVRPVSKTEGNYE